MAVIADVVVALIALLHVYILVLEMFLWEKPAGLRAFGQTREAAAASKVLAANQGLYNGFLAAGLFWGLSLGAGGSAVIGEYDQWRYTRRIGGAARRTFIEAQNAVQRHVLADAHDEFLCAIVDDVIAIGHAARERLGIDLAGPTGQSRDACGGLFRGHAARRCQALGRQKVWMP